MLDTGWLRRALMRLCLVAVAVVPARASAQVETWAMPKASRDDDEPAARRAEPPSPPEELPVTDAGPPPGYHRGEVTRPWRALGGGILFGVAYAPMLLFGYAGLTCERNEYGDCHLKEARPLVIPVLGPLFLLDSNDSELTATMVTDATLQAIGAYLLITGLIPQPAFILDDSRAQVAVLPTVSETGGGLRLLGAF